MTFTGPKYHVPQSESGTKEGAKPQPERCQEACRNTAVKADDHLCHYEDRGFYPLQSDDFGQEATTEGICMR